MLKMQLNNKYGFKLIYNIMFIENVDFYKALKILNNYE